MFDPLDYISTPHTLSCNPVRKESWVSTYLPEGDDQSGYIPQTSHQNVKDHNEDESDDTPISVQDLPLLQYADSAVILVILKLLAPTTQVNFGTADADFKTWTSFIEEKGITMDSFEKLSQYYLTWGNRYLQTPQNICKKIPALLTQDSRDLLSYYTTILSYYDNSDSPVRDELLQQVGLRIAEKCGRTAAPAMTRKFHIEGISQDLFVHEPSLTNDNLGLKTWGASLLLAQKVTNIKPSSFVLELGAGTGLVGIAYAIAHKECKCNIFLTDLPQIVPNLQHNIKLNQLQDVRAAVLDWTDPQTFMDSFKINTFDTILVADPIYSSKHPVWIVNMIEKFLGSAGKAYIEIPIRPKYTLEREMLWELLETKQLEVIKKEYEDGYDDWGPCQYIYAEIVRRRG